MLDENIALEEYVDVEEAISTFIAEKSLNHKDSLSTTHSINRALEIIGSPKFKYLSWQTMDSLDEACACHIMVGNKLVTCIDIVFRRWPIHAEIAKYLVINNVPEHVYRKIRLYVMANSEEAKAILTMGRL